MHVAMSLKPACSDILMHVAMSLNKKKNACSEMDDVAKKTACSSVAEKKYGNMSPFRGSSVSLPFLEPPLPFQLTKTM